MTHRLRRLSTALGSAVLFGGALAFAAAPAQAGGWTDGLPVRTTDRLRVQDPGQLRATGRSGA